MHDVASTPHERLRDRGLVGKHMPAAHFAHSTPRVRRRAISLPPPGPEMQVQHTAADERVLSVARLGGAIVLLVATASDPLHTHAIQVLVLVYAVHTALVAIASTIRPDWLLRRGQLVHGVDLGWGIVATAWSGGAESTLFPVFTFVLVASAFRWGLGATLRDAAIIVVVTAGEWLVSSPADSLPVQHNFTAVRIAYIGVGIGLLFAVLLHRQYALRLQTWLLADIVSKATRATRLEPAVRETLSGVLRLFVARHLLVVIEDAQTGAFERWRADARSDGAVVVSHLTLSRRERSEWMFAEPCHGGGCELRRPARDGSAARITRVLDAARCRPGTMVAVPGALATASSWAVLLTVPVSVAGVWSGYACLLDPLLRPGGDVRLRFLQSLARQVAPPLVNLYLLGRLRSRAEAVERARISRELHDGALPSLAGLEMRVEAIRHVADVVAPGLAKDLREVRDQLHDDASDLRALMERLRSPEVDARRLAGELADQLARFGRATGIDAQLEWSANGLELPRHHCTEVVRVIQEALFNVRRHSGASHVWVGAEIRGCAWTLVIEDDGHGMGFTGRLKHEQLEAGRKGPRVILERVAALGGALDIDSGPGGTRLEITLPLESGE